MNYIKQLNTFYKLLPNNPLSSNAQCLYNYLLNKNNELGWIKEFTVSNMIVCGFTCLSRQALDRARNELKQKGYIEYTKGVSNQAGKYLIVCFDTQDDTHNNTQDDTQCDTQGGYTASTLNKQNETKQNKNNTVYSTGVYAYFEKNIDMLTEKTVEKLEDYQNELPDDLICYAIDKAVGAKKRTPNYVFGVLRNWTNQGIKTLLMAKEEEQKFRKSFETNTMQNDDKWAQFLAKGDD